MAKLSTVDDVILRGGLSESESMQEKVARGLENASIRLALLMETDLARAKQVDHFELDLFNIPLINGGVYLQLRQKFVAKTSIKAVWGLNYAALTDAPETLTLQVTSPERGVVFIAKEDLPDSTSTPIVQVSYTAGFDESSGVFQEVPAWLKELAETEAMNVMQQLIPCEKNEVMTKVDIRAMLGTKMMNQGGAYAPILI